jgi:Type II secretion system (T2SS), protein F
VGAEPLPWVLGLAWGALVAIPLAARARREAPSMRAATLSATAAGSATLFEPAPTPRRVTAWTRRTLARTGPVGRVLGALTRRRRERARDAVLARELPVVLDLLGVAIGSGCTPYLAVEVAARWSPPAVAGPLNSALRACALGAGFDTALDATAQATPLLRPLADALLASDRLGVPVGPVLARLADEERTALRRRAETHARKVPVRLLFPLVFLVLPAFVVLTVVPGLAAGLDRL